MTADVHQTTPRFDPKDSLGNQPWWRIWLYLLDINAAYLWRKLRGRA